MDNSQAFPSTKIKTEYCGFSNQYIDKKSYVKGMTLRDYFAGQALVGLATREGYEPNDVSIDAYKIADFMLAKREVNNETK